MKIIIKKKQPKWHNPVKIIVLILLLVFIYVSFRTDIRKDIHDVSKQTFVEDEISRDGAFVNVNVFKDGASTFKWLNSHEFLIQSDHKEKGIGNYVIDLQSLTLSEEHNTDISLISLDIKGTTAIEVTQIYQDTQKSLYYVNDISVRGLYVTEGENIVNVSYHMALGSNGLPYFIVSEDGSKLLYFEEETLRLVTYNFDTKRKRLINQTAVDDQLKHINNYLKVSSKGGYILYKTEDGLIYVYGADSGKAYLDGFEGINAAFSSNENFLYYFYSGAMTSNFTGTQLGIVDLSTGDVSYDTAEDDVNYLAELIPYRNTDSIYYFNGYFEDNYFTIDTLELYDPQTNEKTISTALNGIKIPVANSINIEDDLLQLMTQEDEIILLDLSDQSSKTLSGLMPFSINGVTYSCYPYDDGFIVNYSNAIYRYNHLGSTKIAEYDGELLNIAISPEYDKVAYYTLNEDGNYSLKFSDKLGENY